MSHPVLETLFFLKIARQSVVESIISSKMEDSKDLINYVKNEASDFEIMHLLTLGEMPDNKYDPVAEQAVWNIFKEAVIMNTESLKKEVMQEDIMTIVYEMGPVSQFGYSSAAPILEFAKSNGQLDINYLIERVSDKPVNKSAQNKTGQYHKAINTPTGSSRGGFSQSDYNKNGVSGNPNSQGSQGYDNELTNIDKSVTQQKIEELPGRAKKAVTAATTALKDRYTKVDPSNKPGMSSDEKTGGTPSTNYKKMGKDTAVAAVAAAGLFGLYKMYKMWKAKKAAAKTAEAKAAADTAMAKIQTKIKAKKGKK